MCLLRLSLQPAPPDHSSSRASHAAPAAVIPSCADPCARAMSVHVGHVASVTCGRASAKPRCAQQPKGSPPNRPWVRDAKAKRSARGGHEGHKESEEMFCFCLYSPDETCKKCNSSPRNRATPPGNRYYKEEAIRQLQLSHAIGGGEATHDNIPTAVR